MATTDPVIKLIQGTDELDLMAGVYIVKTGFVPPEYALRPVTSGTKLVDIDDSQPRRWGFEAGVRLTTETEGRIAARKIINFLRRAGDDNNPVFLAFHPNSDVGFEPLWGQMGGYIYYPIIHGAASLGELYGGSDLRGKGFFLPVDLLLHPYALGLRQRVASATGGIITCQKDGRTNGVILEKAITNVHTNPILGHATYNNSWTAEASLIISPIIDKSLVRFGVRSVKIISTGATTNTFTQTLTLAASTHTAIYYVKLPDGRAVTTAEVEITYNGIDQTTTFVVDPERSDGWYIATAEFTGTGTATTLGVKVNSGYTAYFGMFQCAAVDYSHYPVHGNMLGCSWSGTPHASTSTRVAGRIRQPVGDIFDRGQGTIVMAFRAEDDASPNRGIRDLLEIDTLGVRLRYANPLWTFTDGANTATSNGENGCSTYAEGSINIIHCTYDPVNGIAQYFNGVAMGTDATFTPGATGTYLYIGSSSSASNQIGDEILLFETYGQPMDAATVLTHYTNLTSALADGDKIGDVPWLWTKDGDDTVDNHDDDDEDMFCVMGGIPGSAEAELEIRGTITDDFFVNGAIYLSRLDMPFDNFFLPSGPLYDDRSGVANGNSSGGAYENVTIGASLSVLTLISTAVADRIQFDVLSGRAYRAFARLQDAGSNLSIAVRLELASENFDFSPKSVAPLATFDIVTSELFFVPAIDAIGPLDSDIPLNVTVALYAKRLSGSDTVGIDFFVIMPEPTIFIDGENASAGDDSFFYDSATHSCFIADSATAPTDVSSLAKITGEKFTLAPGRLNMIMSVLNSAGSGFVIADTLTYSNAYVIPKWSLF